MCSGRRQPGLEHLCVELLVWLTEGSRDLRRERKEPVDHFRAKLVRQLPEIVCRFVRLFL